MLASADRLIEAERFAEDNRTPAVSDVERFYREEFQGLELRNACFTYRVGRESPQLLKGMDLTIRKGEYVAFTGPSGCGKSTVLKLLMCLYPLDSGERNVMSTSEKHPLTAGWRGLYAYVPQGNQLMNGTIRDVVTFGEQGVKDRDEAIYRALQIACADQFVRELPQGLDTMLGERGAGLSEGQMQRIAVARAIYSDRPVLLLDEATSALDDATEKQLLKNLRAMTDRTVIIVTHRSAVLDVTDTEIRFKKPGETE
jgi:ATP-binding cassette subfamily B protein